MTHTPRNEFERLSDQDPALGIEETAEFDPASLIANLKARLPEASLGDAFPKASQGDSKNTQASAEVHPLPVLQPEDDTETQLDNQEIAQKSAQHQDNVTELRPAVRGRVAWMQIVASVAVTALVVGTGATALAYSEVNGGGFAGALSSLVTGGTDSYEVGTGSDDTTSQSYAADSNGRDSIGLGSTEDSVTDGSSDVAEGPVDAPSTVGDSSISAAMDGAGTESAASASDASEFRDTYRNRFVGQGLSDAQQASAAYGFDETEAVTKAAFKKLMKRFGVEGKIKQEWGSYSVSGKDSPYLYSSGDGTGAFYYSNNESLITQSKNSKKAALASARSLMADLGMDPDSYTIKAEETEYWTWIEDSVARSYNEGKASDQRVAAGEHKLKIMQVTASLALLEEETWSSQWSFDFMGDELLNASGSLAKLVDLGTYDVVSPTEGVKRLNDTRFGVYNIVYPDGWEDKFYAEIDAAEPSQKSAPKAKPVPQSGRSFAWEVADVILTEATLKNAWTWEEDGSFIIPIWEYSATNGAKYQVMAIADAQLNFRP